MVLLFSLFVFLFVTDTEPASTSQQNVASSTPTLQTMLEPENANDETPSVAVTTSSQVLVSQYSSNGQHLTTRSAGTAVYANIVAPPSVRQRDVRKDLAQLSWSDERLQDWRILLPKRR